MEYTVASFVGAMCSGVVYQDVPHDRGCQTENLCPACPHAAGTVLEAQICFVDQGGWLEGMIAALEAHFYGCKTMHLFIETGGEICPASGIHGFDGNLGRSSCSHVSSTQGKVPETVKDS